MHDVRHGLRNIPLNNYALEQLKEAEWFITDENYKIGTLSCAHGHGEGDYYTGDEYRDKIIAERDQHEGFPEIIYAYSMSTINFGLNPECSKQEWALLGEKMKSTVDNLITTFGFKRNALFSVYPPGGYISWHNNANASAYNFIFTWSENGDGWFKYWDMENNKEVLIPDTPGWQCKAGYFGAYGEPKKNLCYHSAYTNCLRMTVAFTLNRREISLGLQDDIIDEILGS